MTEEAQRIAIAEFCGWTDTIRVEWGHIAFPPKYKETHLNKATLPDYLNDLNAMHEAESLIIGKLDAQGEWLYCEYCTQLLSVKTPGDGTVSHSNLFEDAGWFGAVHATAAQRAEALLRTIGRWDDK